MQEKTIFAPMTPPFVSAVGVIRVSGEKTFEILNNIFSKSVDGVKTHTALHGYIKDGEKTVDDVVVTVYRSPNSYTGEDVAEISCHGSLYVLSAVQKLLLKHGAVLAQGGEFSKRAFINGKMDIIQAEAVIELIEAETEKEASLALSHIKGGLSEKTEKIRQSLIDISAQLLAFVDYPDDEIEEVTSEELKENIKKNYAELKALEKSYDSGKLIKEGVRVCITGKPNAGKSCLMNRLSGYEKSIVTDVEGTTRDVIEESVNFGGMKLRLYDTAGIRESEDAVEKIGVRRAEDEIKKADIIFSVFDLSRPFDENDEKIVKLVLNSSCKKIAVLNKCDKEEIFDESKIFGFDKTVKISSKEDIGIDLLENAVKELFADGFSVDNKEIIMNARQFGCVSGAVSALSHAVENIDFTPDVLLIDIENAIESLSLLSGKTVSEEIISNIFSRFCVGK